MAEPQIVQVDTGTKLLTYLWTGTEPLKVGDLVEVPPNWYKKTAQYLTVAAVDVETDYKGPLSVIVRKVQKEPGLPKPAEAPF